MWKGAAVLHARAHQQEARIAACKVLQRGHDGQQGQVLQRVAAQDQLMAAWRRRLHARAGARSALEVECDLLGLACCVMLNCARSASCTVLCSTVPSQARESHEFAA